MRVSLVSDLHLEFCPISLPGGETLLLVGDICVADYLRPTRTDKGAKLMTQRVTTFFKQVSDRYQHAYYIMGNHEHYNGVFKDTPNILRDFLKPWSNITFLENEAVPLTANTMMFGATMWTDYNGANPMVMETARTGMNDHYCIAYDGVSEQGRVRKFLPPDALDDFGRTQRLLTKALADHPDQNFLVMTHHCPSFQSIHPKYHDAGDLNYAFSSDLSKTMLDNPRIKWWVHGHTHDSFKYAIGDCQVMCNPRGYTRIEHVPPENVFFDPNFTFEVP